MSKSVHRMFASVHQCRPPCQCSAIILHYSCSTIGSLQLHPRNAVCGCRLDGSLYPDSNPD